MRLDKYFWAFPEASIQHNSRKIRRGAASYQHIDGSLASNVVRILIKHKHSLRGEKKVGLNASETLWHCYKDICRRKDDKERINIRQEKNLGLKRGLPLFRSPRQGITQNKMLKMCGLP